MRGRSMRRGAGQIGSPKFTSIPTVSRAVPSVAVSLTRTPAYSSSSRIVVAATLAGSNTRPSATSSAAMSWTRSATSPGAPGGGGAGGGGGGGEGRLLGGGGGRRPGGPPPRPSARSRPGTRIARFAPAALRARIGSSVPARPRRSAGRECEWRWSRRLPGYRAAGSGSQQHLQCLLDRGARLREALRNRQQRGGAVAALAQPPLERAEGEVATPGVPQPEQVDQGALGGVQADGQPARQSVLAAADAERVGVEAVPGDGRVMYGDRLRAARDGDVASGGDLVGQLVQRQRREQAQRRIGLLRGDRYPRGRRVVREPRPQEQNGGGAPEIPRLGQPLKAMPGEVQRGQVVVAQQIGQRRGVHHHLQSDRIRYR